MTAATNTETLTDVLDKAGKGGEVARKAHGALIPILQKEDLEYHVDRVIEQYKDVRDALQQKPYLRDMLREYARQTLQEYKWMLYGAKTVDSIDKITAVAELGAGIFGPEAEMGVKGITETAEYILKIPYTAYYAVKSGDYVAPLYFVAAEAASLIPYAGEAVDFMDLYTNRVRGQIQKKTAKRFLEEIVKKEKAKDINLNQ